MTDVEILAALTDRSVLGLTLYAEAGNQGLTGLAAVGCVIRTRVDDPRWPDTVKAVCLQPKQFSCWNPGGDANHTRLMAMAERLVSGQPVLSASVTECLWLADGVIAGVVRDPTKGATHYFSPLAMLPAGRVPDWAKGKRPITIGDHRFLKL